MRAVGTGTWLSVYRVHDLAALGQYKYSAVDDSYLSLWILNPFWTWVASFMPPWLAYAALAGSGGAAAGSGMGRVGAGSRESEADSHVERWYTVA